MWEHAKVAARSRRRVLGAGATLLAGLPFWNLLLRGRPTWAQTAPVTTAPFTTTGIFTTSFVTTAPFTTTGIFTTPFVTTAPFTTTAIFTTPIDFTTVPIDFTTLPFTTPPFTEPPGGDTGGTTPVPEPGSAILLGSQLAIGAAWFWGRAVKDRVRSLLETLVGDDPE